MRTKLKRPRQCIDCPFIVGVLSELLDGLEALAAPGCNRTNLWDCHDTNFSDVPPVCLPCIGWLNNQSKEGHNARLNAFVAGCSNADEISVRGKQKEMFEVLVVGNERRDASDRPYSPKSSEEAYALIYDAHGLECDQELLKEYHAFKRGGEQQTEVIS